VIKEIGIGSGNEVHSVKMPPSCCRLGYFLFCLSIIFAFVYRNSSSLLCTSSMDLSEIESLDPAVFFTQVGITHWKNWIFYIYLFFQGCAVKIVQVVEHHFGYLVCAAIGVLLLGR
jgi:hypothetical protein